MSHPCHPRSFCHPREGGDLWWKEIPASAGMTKGSRGSVRGIGVKLSKEIPAFQTVSKVTRKR